MAVAATRNQGEFRHKYLQLADLRRLEYLLFAPRRIVEGRYSGHYATRQRGQSVEFRDYRQYLPGDDIGGIDWKVYGRSDKLFIKLFEHQSELTVNLLIDASGSMAYRGQLVGDRRAPQKGLSKYDYACFLAASIGFLVMKQHDRFSCGFAQRGLQRYAPPESTMRHLTGILRRMEALRPRGRARLPVAIDELTRQGSRRSLLIVLSDLIDEPDAVAKALAARTQAGGEAIVFQILHPDELNLPDIDHGLFIDSETAARVRLNVSEIRDEYKQRMRDFIDGWFRRCLGLGVDYARALTNEPYYKILERYLVGREQRRA
ncbi:MAG: DUF58 domain-containing protein [Planctomycetota bacterium]|nr:MAG: DUF58 domain-containing protein [Planctomycetota bacterium]REK30341.1 MAG: DUF58 domain-containing protein [Planctomycetota bacterium]REK31508.1 MAG: DUF58 domain-containing protein [Planctomycetota bacterium]